MKTTEFDSKITAEQLNESMFKKFGVKVNFDKYTREELENYRNLLRTNISQYENQTSFNDLLTDETYQKNKHLVNLLNQKIKEMLGESLLVEKAVSIAQQQKAAIELKKRREGKGKSKDGMGSMSTTELEKFASTKHTGLPKRKPKKAEESIKDTNMKKTTEATKSQKATKDWDGDGKIEKAKDEVWGSRAKAAAKAGKPFKEDMKVGDTKKTRTGVMTKTATGVKHTRTDYSDDEQGAVNKTHAKSKTSAEKAKQAPAQKQSKTGTWGMKDGQKFDNRNKNVKEGLPMVKGPDGKMVPKFAADGKGKKDLKKSKMDEAKATFRRHVATVNESLALLLQEDEEGKAKSITAASDMVNDYTTWMQRVGQYQTKSMIELADAIRADFGQMEAESFKQAVMPALSATLEVLTQQREAISNAVAVLAGEAAQAIPMGAGQEGPEGMDGMPAEPDTMNASDEFAASDAAAGGAEAAGRELRESRLRAAHSIMRTLAK